MAMHIPAKLAPFFSHLSGWIRTRDARPDYDHRRLGVVKVSDRMVELCHIVPMEYGTDELQAHNTFSSNSSPQNKSDAKQDTIPGKLEQRH
jgi:hypothetical protein